MRKGGGGGRRKGRKGGERRRKGERRGGEEGAQERDAYTVLVPTPHLCARTGPPSAPDGLGMRALSRLARRGGSR